MIAAAQYLLWAVVAVAIGYWMVDRCAMRDNARLGALQLCLGFGLGMGLTAIVYFVSLMFFGARSLAFFGMDLAILAVLLLGRILRSRGNGTQTTPVLQPMPYGDVSIPLLAITGSVFLVTVIFKGSAFIHGGWDAWMIWNVRARWIFRAGTEWSASSFSPLLANADYPLFLPSTILQGWNMLGGESTRVTVSIGIAFELAVAALMFAALWRLSSPTKAILGTWTLMATPLLVELGSYQYADVPIAYFFLTTLVFFGLYDYIFPGRKEWLALAGFSAGICCWTKNEGALFLGVLIVARIVTASSVGLKLLGRELLYFVAGALAPVAVLFYFKHTFAPPSAMFGQQTVAGLVSQIFDPSRHALLLPAFLRECLRFGLWRISPLPFLAIYAAVAGVDKRRNHRRFLATCTAVFLMMLGGYYTVYLTEAVPVADLQQHLNLSLNRLLFQLWPIFLLVYFLGVRSPFPEKEADDGDPSTIATRIKIPDAIL